jgi:putative ABC transport system permease protein
MQNLWHDLRPALRILYKNLGFTTVAVLTLALGIGANTAIFSVVKAVLLRPLPFRDPNRLAMIYETVGKEENAVSYPNFLDWRKQSNAFESMAAFASDEFVVNGSGRAERISGEFVSDNYFSLLGVNPIQGRPFLPAENETPMRDAVALISDGLWQRAYGATLTLSERHCG